MYDFFADKNTWQQAQDIFMTVVSHLRKQGKQSLNPNNTLSLYRGPDGHKCAIGILIFDECYDEKMEGKHIDWILEDPSFKGLDHLKPFKELLERLQDIHDIGMLHLFDVPNELRCFEQHSL